MDLNEARETIATLHEGMDDQLTQINTVSETCETTVTKVVHLLGEGHSSVPLLEQAHTLSDEASSMGDALKNKLEEIKEVLASIE